MAPRGGPRRTRAKRASADRDGAPRYLALGDSYTVGEGIEPGESWPVQLVRALRSRGVAVAEPEIIARTGWTTAELDRALMDQRLQGPFALVTVLSGVNNQYRGMIVRVYRHQLRRLLHHAVQLSGDPERVVVVSIPDWGVTPFNTKRMPTRVAQEIDSYNRASREIAASAGAHWVDITDLSRADPDAVTADGLHPSPAMYTRWVERILPVARAAIKGARR